MTAPKTGVAAETSQRLDKWLWHARFFKTRSQATSFVKSGKLRLNDTKIAKAHQAVRVGDVLTFPKARDIRIVRVLDLAERRGPYREAKLLYDDIGAETPAVAAETEAPAAEPAPAEREAGSGRPTKRDRRALERLIDWFRS